MGFGKDVGNWRSKKGTEEPRFFREKSTFSRRPDGCKRSGSKAKRRYRFLGTPKQIPLSSKMSPSNDHGERFKSDTRQGKLVITFDNWDITDQTNYKNTYEYSTCMEPEPGGNVMGSRSSKFTMLSAEL